MGLNRTLISILKPGRIYNITPSRVETLTLHRRWAEIGEHIKHISAMIPDLFAKRDSHLEFRSYPYILLSGEGAHLGTDKESEPPPDSWPPARTEPKSIPASDLKKELQLFTFAVPVLNCPTTFCISCSSLQGAECLTLHCLQLHWTASNSQDRPQFGQTSSDSPGRWIDLSTR